MRNTYVTHVIFSPEVEGKKKFTQDINSSDTLSYFTVQYSVATQYSIRGLAWVPVTVIYYLYYWQRIILIYVCRVLQYKSSIMRPYSFHIKPYFIYSRCCNNFFQEIK